MTNRRLRGDRRRPQVTSYEWLLVAAGLLGATIGGWEAVVGVIIGLGLLRQFSKQSNR